jgi:hypothetical protein
MDDKTRSTKNSMKHCYALVMVLSAGLWVMTGCGHKADANSQLEMAATELAKSEPAPAPQAPVQNAPAPQPNQPAAPEVAQAAAPSQQMSQAMAAYKAGNLEDAVTRLQKLRATQAITPQQRIALNDAMAAVMTEIYTMAAKGDGRAIAAVKQYELLQTHRQ